MMSPFTQRGTTKAPRWPDREQVDHHPPVGDLQLGHDLLDRGRPVAVAQGDRAVEAGMVAFGVEHAELVVLLGEALQQAGGELGLARTRRARQQEPGAVGGHGDVAVVAGAEQQPVPGQAVLRVGQVGADQPVDQRGDRLAVAALHDQVALLLDRRRCVGDGDGAFAAAQEAQVALGVPDADDVVERQAERAEGGGQPGRLVGAGRHGQDHVLVGDHGHVDALGLDHLADHRPVGRGGRRRHLAGRPWLDAAGGQLADQGVGQPRRQRPGLAGGRPPQQAAVLGHHAGEQVGRGRRGRAARRCAG
jgi:hypothetical protein